MYLFDTLHEWNPWVATRSLEEGDTLNSEWADATWNFFVCQTIKGRGLVVSGQSVVLIIKLIDIAKNDDEYVLKVYNPFQAQSRKRCAARECLAQRELQPTGKFPQVLEFNVGTYDSAADTTVAEPGYIIMTKVSGTNLTEWRKKNTPNPSQAIAMIQELAKFLPQHWHRAP